MDLPATQAIDLSDYDLSESDAPSENIVSPIYYAIEKT